MKLDVRSTSAIGLAVLSIAGSTFAQSKADNGNFGNYRRQAEALGPVLVYPKGGLEIDPTIIEVTHPASGIGLLNGEKMITDEIVANRIFNSFISGYTGEASYESLVVHVGGCFGGGFLDELDDARFPRLSANTSAAWDKLQIGTEQNNFPANGPKTARGYYTREWIDNLASNDNGKLKTVYSKAIVGNGDADRAKNPYPQDIREKERPQYFSRSTGSDDIKLGTATDKKLAMIYVGNAGVNKPGGRTTTDRRWYNDAVAYRSKLIGLGYDEANIKFLYDNGTAPDGVAAPGFTIGAATRAAFFDTFSGFLKNNVAGGNDQVALFLSGHGGLYDNFNGKIRMTVPALPPPPGVNPLRATFQFSMGADQLAAMTDPEAGIEYITVSGDPLENMTPGETVTVSLANTEESIVQSIGTLDYTATNAPWSFNFSQSLFTSLFASPGSAGAYELIFSGTNSQTVLNNFGVSVDAAGIVSDVPEPGTLAIATIALLGLLRRRRAVSA